MGASEPAPSRALRGSAVLADPLVRELLGLRLIAVLGTVGRDGLPHLTPVWFADDGEAVLLATSSTSHKVAYLEREPRAALVLHDSRPGFEVRGASITGRAEFRRGPDAVPLVERVHARYVDDDGLRLPEVSGFLAADDVALRLVPERAWTWDQRGTPADRALRARGGGLLLEPTAPSERGSAG
jgi:PPOX class probable F420-dependent enzyme